jgi:hypothetical protein
MEEVDRDQHVYTAVLKSIPAPTQASWRVKNEDTNEWIPIHANSEEYRGTTNSLPKPILIVKTTKMLTSRRIQIEVKNFIGTNRKDILGLLHVIFISFVFVLYVFSSPAFLVTHYSPCVHLPISHFHFFITTGPILNIQVCIFFVRGVGVNLKGFSSIIFL